jgi:hypothetical protein
MDTRDLNPEINLTDPLGAGSAQPERIVGCAC